MPNINKLVNATSDTTRGVHEQLTKAAVAVEEASARLHQALAGVPNNEARETLAMYSRLAMDIRLAAGQAEAANIALGIYAGSL